MGLDGVSRKVGELDGELDIMSYSGWVTLSWGLEAESRRRNH